MVININKNADENQQTMVSWLYDGDMITCTSNGV